MASVRCRPAVVALVGFRVASVVNVRGVALVRLLFSSGLLHSLVSIVPQLLEDVRCALEKGGPLLVF
jgi:hypothetical protein